MIRFVFFMLHDVSESNPDEAIVLPNTAAPMRFNAYLRLILFFVLILCSKINACIYVLQR